MDAIRQLGSFRRCVPAGDAERYVLLLMRARNPIHLALVLILCGCSPEAERAVSPQFDAASPVDSSSNDLRREVEPKLKSILPNGWSLSLSGSTLSLTRNEKLIVYNPVQRPIWEKPEDTARNAGREISYTITLRFEPLLSKEEYERLKRERAPYEKIIDEGARTAEEWASALKEFHRHKVPIYFTDKYSIYAEKPDIFPLRIYSESAAAECKQVLESLDKLFQRYERQTGKDSDFKVRT